MPYQVIMREQTLKSLSQLPREVSSVLYRRLEGIADLAEVSPPFKGIWRTLAIVQPPLLRTEVDGYQLLYDLDPVGRRIRVLEISPRH